MDLLSARSFFVVSTGVAAAYAAWLLRQFGAAVDHRSTLDPERAGAFFAEGARFGSATLPNGPGPALITDVAVTPAHRAAIEALSRERPVIWLTPWGLDNAWEGRPWSNLLLAAAGGWMSAVGEPGKEPLAPPGSQPQAMAPLFATIHAIVRGSNLFGPPATAGLTIVSMAEAVTVTCIYDAVSYQYYGIVRERAGDRFSRTQPTQMTGLCKDGYLGLHAALHNQWISLCRVIGHPELTADPRFTTIPERWANIREFDRDYLAPWLLTKSRWEAFHELQQARIPTSGLPTFQEVLDSPQLAARDFWAETTTPDGHRLRVPGPPVRVQGGAVSDRAGRPDGPWTAGKIRVVDLSMGWAGPMVSHVLACYGADVIKVEACQKFDWWRGSRPPGDDPTLVLHERSPVFNTVNRGKRAVTLDLRNPEGNALARQLIATADVVVENFIPGVMEKLGLDYATISRDNPGLILLRQPGFGSTGPESGYAIVGPTIEGQSGLTNLLGYRGGIPLQMSNALGDPISGLTGTIAVLAALEARSADDRGRLVELSQLEGFLPFVTEWLIDWQRDGRVPARNGNRRTGATPSGAFRASDGDRWLAIEVRSDDEWRRLAMLIGLDPSKPADGPGRLADEAWIEAAVGAWVAGRERDEAVEQLAAAGVTVAPVHNEPDILAFQPFTDAELFTGYDREHVGYHLYPALAVREERARPLAPSAAPTLGQNNDAVLSGLGLSAEAIAGLRERHVIGERPV